MPASTSRSRKPPTVISFASFAPICLASSGVSTARLESSGHSRIIAERLRFSAELTVSDSSPFAMTLPPSNASFQ